MLPAPQNAMQRVKQSEYYRHLIKEAFDIIDYKNEGTIDKKEVS